MKYLKELKGYTNIYYGGWDDKPHPQTLNYKLISIAEHIRYLKILSLLADHIAIPPTFIVSGIKTKNDSEYFKIHLLDFFRNSILLTSVYNSMVEARDFIDYKIFAGSIDEKKIFKNRKIIATDIFSKLPTFQRNIQRMSTSFKERLIININEIEEKTLSQDLKEKIIKKINLFESKNEVTLSQDNFEYILKQLPLNREQYNSCFYAMKAAYYSEGAETYYGLISLPNVEQYHLLGPKIFTDVKSGVVIAYDPRLFLFFLSHYQIYEKEIDQLDLNTIIYIRDHPFFKTFKKKYFDFCKNIQLAYIINKVLSPDLVELIKKEIENKILDKYLSEDKRIRIEIIKLLNNRKKQGICSLPRFLHKG